jgi:membrane associated rhomboid family serine protease
MGATRPIEGPHTSAGRPQKRSGWLVGGATIISFVALLYIVELFDLMDDHKLEQHGIRPGEADGLWGILFAPLLHANWAHLMANTGPALVLGFLVTLAGLSRFLWATAIVWIVGGFGTWLIGNWGSSCGLESDHIGASGLIFGWLTFLLVFGFFTRSGWQILIGILVLVGYGGVLWGAVPVLNVCGGVSWQGHLCGGIAGVLAAYLLSSPERKARELRRRGPQRPLKA